MDVNGLLVAASEIIKFEQGKAILFTFWNEIMKFSFYVLFDVNSAHVCDVQVNKFYKFMDLKVGCLEMVSGKKLILFKTMPSSCYFEIDEEINNEFSITAKLKELVSSSKIKECIETECKAGSPLICYEGVVTNIKASYGVFELDGKTILYTSFNSLRTKMPALRMGSKLFISNVHLMHNRSKPLLVCCGLSSVKIISSINFEEEKNIVDYFVLNNMLSIYDVLWIESLYENLRRKFFSLIPLEEISLDTNKDLLESLLSVLLVSQSQTLSFEKYSVVQEYCSYPHTCLPFSENRIPKADVFLSLKDILKEAGKKNSWFQVSEQWNISFTSDSSKPLIGMLYLSENHCLFIEDSSFSIPVVLIKDCADCSFSDNILPKFNVPDFSLLVLIQDYQIVFESIKFTSKTYDYLIFVRTSPCSIYPLKAFCRPHQRTKSLSDAVMKKLTIQEKFVYENFNSESDFLSPNTIDVNQDVGQKIVILSKLWLTNVEPPVCSRVLALTLPQENNYSNLSFQNNSFNFYETEDDIEFANLINGIDSLCINSVPRFISLYFEEEYECNLFFPGHIYSVDLNDVSFMGNSKSANINEENSIFPMKMKSGSKIVHYSCIKEDDFNLADVKYYGIKEIILQNQIPSNAFVRGVLVDKFLKENRGSIKCEKSLQRKKTVLCLCLRDLKETDTLFVYFPLQLRDISGLMPGAILELYGFQCIRSQKGYLYLRASPIFGIEASTYVTGGNWEMISKYGNELYQSAAKDELSRFYINTCLFQKCLKQICFISKLVTAELALFCKKCFKDAQEMCGCSFSYSVQAKASAIIDDGRIQLLCYFREDAVREILGFNMEDWQTLISNIEQTHVPLKYNEKMNIKDISILPLMNQIFSVYCLNGSIKRQMIISFYIFPCSESNGDSSFCAHCVDVCNVTVKDCLMELYVNFKKFKEHDL